VFLTAPASFISASDDNEYILAFLCSKTGRYYIYKNSDTTGAGDIMLNIQSLIRFPIPIYRNSQIINLIHHIIDNCKEGLSISNAQALIDKEIYSTYKFSEQEIHHIENVS
jgi:adenine-specific DNA-methyltransferase